MRDTEHLQIALEEARFSGCAVLHDIGKVEFYLFAEDHDREVGLVNFRLGAFRESLAHGVRPKRAKIS